MLEPLRQDRGVVVFGLFVAGVGVWSVTDGSAVGWWWVGAGAAIVGQALYRRVRPLEPATQEERILADAAEGGRHPYAGNIAFAVAAAVVLRLIKPDDEFSAAEQIVLAAVAMSVVLNVLTYYDRRRARALRRDRPPG